MDFSFSGIDFIQSGGGFTLIILFICAIVSWITIVERIIYFNTNSLPPLETVNIFLQKENTNSKENLTNLSWEEKYVQFKTPLEYVLYECHCAVVLNKKKEEYFEETKSRAIAERLPEIEKYLSIQATLGTVSPYLGLLGTVFGIIRAFSSLGVKADANSIGNSVLTSGIAEALIATASGLIVAIPATIAYNYFKKRQQSMIRDIEIAASYLKGHIL